MVAGSRPVSSRASTHVLNSLDRKQMTSSQTRNDPTPASAAPLTDPEVIKHYHAHIYYDPASSRDRAARLRERVAAAFPEATLGRWHDALVGPHLQSMYQIAFPRNLLATFLPWLMLNRDGLTILLHPGTGDACADHTEHAVWLGCILPLRLDVLRAAR